VDEAEDRGAGNAAAEGAGVRMRNLSGLKKKIDKLEVCQEFLDRAPEFDAFEEIKVLALLCFSTEEIDLLLSLHPAKQSRELNSMEGVSGCSESCDWRPQRRGGKGVRAVRNHRRPVPQATRPGQAGGHVTQTATDGAKQASVRVQKTAKNEGCGVVLRNPWLGTVRAEQPQIFSRFGAEIVSIVHEVGHANT
jgi:hypothetical protein